MNHQVHPVAALPVKGSNSSSMGSILLEAGKLTLEDASRVLELQREHGVRFGEAALRLGLITEADIQQALAQQFDYHYVQPDQNRYPPELVAAYQPFSEQVEMLRTVRAQLMQHWFGCGRKALMVASANQGEGVSFFAANLAVVFSQLGERTLLIDANLRRPQQHKIFNLEGRQGLSDILANRAGMETFSKVDPFNNLSVLLAGTLPPNPQELVSRGAFNELNKSLDNRFDVILVDTSPFSAGADAMTIAARIGGVLLVCRRNQASLTDIGKVATQLKRIGIEAVGSVLVDF
ncbi:MAG TPA: chain length determinant protein tyrosine kinase EpsG [Burkholderiaceae bacterium]|nr:chain length determinant protein tyrosine kinase EpsG [Burkholderiaceae bacterium]